MYFSAMFFSVTRHQILLVAIVVNLVYTYLTRIQFMYDNPIEIWGSGGAIYLPYLVLHHTAWSAQEGMSTF